MKFLQQFCMQNPKLTIFFIALLVFTGGGGIVKNAYINDAEFYGLVQSLIARLPDIMSQFHL